MGSEFEPDGLGPVVLPQELQASEAAEASEAVSVGVGAASRPWRGSPPRGGRSRLLRSRRSGQHRFARCWSTSVGGHGAWIEGLQWVMVCWCWFHDVVVLASSWGVVSSQRSRFPFLILQDVVAHDGSLLLLGESVRLTSHHCKPLYFGFVSIQYCLVIVLP